jgi:hypothetical protein
VRDDTRCGDVAFFDLRSSKASNTGACTKSVQTRFAANGVPEFAIFNAYPRILDRAAIKTGTADSRIGFATEGGGWKIWDRILTVDGKKVYHLGNICQTCQFLFERLDGANTSVNIESAVDALATGVHSISDPVVAQLGTGLPDDDYLV